MPLLWALVSSAINIFAHHPLRNHAWLKARYQIGWSATNTKLLYDAKNNLVLNWKPVTYWERVQIKEMGEKKPCPNWGRKRHQSIKWMQITCVNPECYHLQSWELTHSSQETHFRNKPLYFVSYLPKKITFCKNSQGLLWSKRAGFPVEVWVSVSCIMDSHLWVYPIFKPFISTTSCILMASS